jgi:hypothetical protein
MRKRGQPRPAEGADDMWFTAPPGKKDEPEVSAGDTRADAPTYEDTWYKILRGRDDTAPTDEPETADA